MENIFVSDVVPLPLTCCLLFLMYVPDQAFHSYPPSTLLEQVQEKLCQGIHHFTLSAFGTQIAHYPITELKHQAPAALPAPFTEGQKEHSKR